MTALTLGDAKPGQKVTLARSGEAVIVRKQDRDDFGTWTLCYCPERRKRSTTDSQVYQFARNTECSPVRVPRPPCSCSQGGSAAFCECRE